MAVSVRDRTCKRPAKLMAGARCWARRRISPLATSAVLVRWCQLPWIVTSSGFMEGMDGPETLSRVAYSLVVPKGCDPCPCQVPLPPTLPAWPQPCAVCGFAHSPSLRSALHPSQATASEIRVWLTQHDLPSQGRQRL